MLSVVVPIGSFSAVNSRLSEWNLENLPTNLELILVLDGENSESAFCRTDISSYLKLPFVKVVSGNFGAPGLARNAGMELCAGEWIAFWDVDDIPDVDEILHQVAQVEMDEEVLVGQFEIIDSQSCLSLERSSTKNSWGLAKDPGLWRVVFRRKSIAGIRFVSGKMGEDQDFLIQTGFWEKKVKFVDKNFYKYFVNQNQQLTSSTSNISDLKAILLRTLNSLNLDRNNDVLRIFAARQLITIFKRGNIKVKISIIQDFLSLFRYSAPILSIHLLRGLTLVFLIKVKA